VSNMTEVLASEFSSFNEFARICVSFSWFWLLKPAKFSLFAFRALASAFAVFSNLVLHDN